MEYTPLELQLINAAISFEGNPQFERTAMYDNTPFQTLDNGLRVRATRKGSHSPWEFKCIARTGYTGQEFPRLQQSIDHALAEKEAYTARVFAGRMNPE